MIAIVGPSQRFLSGVSYYTIRLANALSNHTNVKVVLFRKMLPKRFFPGRKRVGAKLTSLKFNENVEVHEILDWYNPITWFNAYKLLKDCKTVIFQWWTSSVAHMILFLELMCKLKDGDRKNIIIEFHEVLDPLESSILLINLYFKTVRRFITKLADHYVVHSKSEKEIIKSAYNIASSKISVIPHGVYDHYKTIENAKKALKITENFVILFFGLIRPYKGLKYLIDAFNLLPEDVAKNARLLIVGETWEDKSVPELISKSRFKDKITFVNRYVSDYETSLYFSAADVLVLPYVRASQSGVGYIGMHFGLPILATEVGGLKSLSEYKGTTFVKTRDEQDLSKAILHVYEKRRKFDTPRRFKWDYIAKKWMELF